jgi:hypothetical protein
MSRSDESAEPVEEYEHIPWAQLAVPSREKKPWVVYLAAGVIAVAALGAMIVRSVGSAPEPPSAALPVIGAVPVTTAPPPPQSEAPIFTEADLLAATPGQREVSASARAEWFVSDYFSTGGDPGSHQQVLDALPEGARLPAEPGAESSSYVEWIATSRVGAIGNERFRSTVLFRLLVSTNEEGYVRLPVQAVDVVVEVDGGGATRVVDLPMPVEIPAGQPVSAWAESVGEIPDPVRAGALRIAGSWGAEPALIEASERNDGWRVVVVVTDGAGVRWPLSLWLTDQGDPAWQDHPSRP